MFFQTIKIAVRALLLNKTRSLLTMLGIIIGITAVIVVISAGAGAQELIVNQVKGIGSNLLFVTPGGSGKKSALSAPASSQGIVVTSLTSQDARSLENPLLAPDIQYVSPQVRGQYQISYGQTSELTPVLGDDQNYGTIADLPLASGAWFSSADVNGLSQVAVIGSQLATDLFGEQDPIGKLIQIHKVNFSVVGVLAPKGVGTFGVNQDEEAIVPVSTEQQLLLGINYYNLIDVQVTDTAHIPQATAEIEQVLEKNHKISDPNKDDFTITNPANAVALLGTITGVLTTFLAAIAGISLLVGGIGIMNIMLVSVTERTREIGLRKAIGAKRSDILLQFLVEAIFLTVAGGAIGIFLGWLGSIVLARVGGWTAVVSLSSIGLAFGVSALFGLVFGIYPANKASKLSPIEALRYE
jgi:putative ABC transport system permease protein